MQIANKFRLYPNKQTEQKMLETLEICRQGYNTFLGELNQQKEIDKSQIQGIIPDMKICDRKFKNIHSKTLQYECYKLFSNLSALAQTKKKGRKVGSLRFKGKGKLFKDKWQQIYYDAHEKYVGKKVDWKTLDEIENSDTVQKLKILQKTRCINDYRFTESLLKITKVKDLKCMEFNVDELKSQTMCPHCSFPNMNEDALLNINSQIEGLNTEFENILQQWESHIVNEIQHNQKNAANLEHEERRIVQKIQSQGYLDKNISEETINAINNLLQDLEIKEVDLQELYKKLTEETDVLKVDNFKEKIEAYLDEILKAENKDNVRLKIKKITKE